MNNLKKQLRKELDGRQRRPSPGQKQRQVKGKLSGATGTQELENKHCSGLSGTQKQKLAERCLPGPSWRTRCPLGFSQKLEVERWRCQLGPL